MFQIDKTTEYVTIQTGSLLIDAESVHAIEKHIDELKRRIKECKDCTIYVDDKGVEIEDNLKYCRDYYMGTVNVEDCTLETEFPSLEKIRAFIDEHGLYRGALSWYDDRIEYSTEKLSVECPREKFGDCLEHAREVLEKFEERYPDFGIAAAIIDNDCSVEIKTADRVYYVPCDWEDELPEFSAGVIDLTEGEPKVSTIIEKDGVLYHIERVSPWRVETAISRWEPIVKSIGATEVSIHEDGITILEPALVGIHNDTITYFIEGEKDAEFARKFFEAIGRLGEFERELSIISRVFS